MNECQIFMAALEKGSAPELQSFLDESCGGNLELRRRIESLLQSHKDAGSLLEHPVCGEAPTHAPDASQVSTDGTGQSRSNRPIPAPEIALDFLAPSTEPQTLGCIGPYTVTGVIGRGGMGVV